MPKQHQPRESLAPTERLTIRISNMINSPQAQIRRLVLIHRLETDPQEAWNEVTWLLADTDGVRVEPQENGDILVAWERQESDGSLDEHEAEAPF